MEYLYIVKIDTSEDNIAQYLTRSELTQDQVKEHLSMILDGKIKEEQDRDKDLLDQDYVDYLTDLTISVEPCFVEDFNSVAARMPQMLNYC